MKTRRYKIGDKVDFRRASWGEDTEELLRGGLIISVVQEETLPGLNRFSVFRTQSKLASHILSGKKHFYYQIQLPDHAHSISDRTFDPEPEYVDHDLIFPDTVGQYSIEELLTHSFTNFRLVGEALRKKRDKK